jgi:HAD superfamily hydrolase (TIGR01509 family)
MTGESFSGRFDAARARGGVPSRYRAVFLDIGGTLLHPDRAFILDCLREHGFLVEAAAYDAAEAVARERVAEKLRSGHPGDDAARARLYWGTLLEALGCDSAALSSIGAAIAARNQEGRLWFEPEPGAADALAQLRRDGCILAAVSNSDGRAETYLQAAGLRDLLDFVVDSAIVGVEKPDPRIFEIACERAGVAPHEAVHVGDIYEVDVVGARKAGLAALLVDPGRRHTSLDCERIRSVSELPGWLRSARPAAAD